MKVEEIDKTGLIGESYRIDGIDLSQCRSIFLDWALKLPESVDQREAIGFMLRKHGAHHPDHPMTLVLKDGLGSPEHKGRRGGRKARIAP